MHRNVLFTFGLIVYFIVATYGSIQFDLGILLSSLLILAIPTYFLARFSAAPPVLLVTVASFGAGMTFLFEGLGYLYGLWELSSPNGFTILGTLSIGVLVLTVLKVLFLVLFYELIFDDGEYSIALARDRVAEIGFFAIGSVILVSLFYVFFDRLSSPEMYYWITLILVGSSVSMLALRQSITLRLFNKITYFSAVAAVPMLSIEALLVNEGYKSFTNVVDPVSVALVGGALPLGEILLAFAVPTFVATLYELYLDDRV